MRMRRKKWARPELEVCDYFIQEPSKNCCKWKNCFKRELPMQLELGCGKGVSLAAAALHHPDKNFIGVDISQDILGVARRNIANTFKERPVDNILLTAFDIQYCSQYFGNEDAFERIYIYFCNPWSKNKHHKRRLTHPRQLKQYRSFLGENGEIFFKTDDLGLFNDSIQYFENAGFKIDFLTRDLHQSQWGNLEKSEHEIMFSRQGLPIYFLIAKKV